MQTPLTQHDQAVLFDLVQVVVNGFYASDGKTCSRGDIHLYSGEAAMSMPVIMCGANCLSCQLVQCTYVPGTK